MNEKKKSRTIVDLLVLIAGIVMAAGAATFLKPCGPQEDGSWMTCHWAGQAVLGVSVLICILALICLILPDAKVKTGLSIGIIGAAALNALLPGFLIQTCLMESMRCNSVMRPGVMVASAVVAALALVNIIVSAVRSRKGAGQ